jgi:hypothetical protein
LHTGHAHTARGAGDEHDGASRHVGPLRQRLVGGQVDQRRARGLLLGPAGRHRHERFDRHGHFPGERPPAANADLAAQDREPLASPDVGDVRPDFGHDADPVAAQHVRQRRPGGVLRLCQVPVGRIQRGEVNVHYHFLRRRPGVGGVGNAELVDAGQ